MYLLGFQGVWDLCALLFLLSSIRFFFEQQNHTNVLIFPINTFPEQCIYCRCHIINFNQCKIQVKSALNWGWQGRYIYRPDRWQSFSSLLVLTDGIKFPVSCPHASGYCSKYSIIPYSSIFQVILSF